MWPSPQRRRRAEEAGWRKTGGTTKGGSVAITLQRRTAEIWQSVGVTAGPALAVTFKREGPTLHGRGSFLPRLRGRREGRHGGGGVYDEFGPGEEGIQGPAVSATFHGGTSGFETETALPRTGQPGPKGLATVNLMFPAGAARALRGARWSGTSRRWSDSSPGPGRLGSRPAQDGARGPKGRQAFLDEQGRGRRRARNRSYAHANVVGGPPGGRTRKTRNPDVALGRAVHGLLGGRDRRAHC